MPYAHSRSSIEDTRVVETRTDLDSHADQCAIGSNALVFYDFDRPINVTGYDPKGPVQSGTA
jgi:hypothetical protein